MSLALVFLFSFYPEEHIGSCGSHRPSPVQQDKAEQSVHDLEMHNALGRCEYPKAYLLVSAMQGERRTPSTKTTDITSTTPTSSNMLTIVLIEGRVIIAVIVVMLNE
jgi:hypothetical protein